MQPGEPTALISLTVDPGNLSSKPHIELVRVLKAAVCSGTLSRIWDRSRGKCSWHFVAWMLGFLMALCKKPPKYRVWYLHVEII